MLKENQVLKIRWQGNNKSHFVERGYVFTKIGDYFCAHAEDLMNGSNAEIICICDNCSKEMHMSYSTYVKHYKNKEIQLCSDCRLLLKQQEWDKQLQKFCLENNYILNTSVYDLSNIHDRVSYICPIHGEKTVELKGALQNQRCYECTRSINFDNYRKNTFSKRMDKLYAKCINNASEKGYLLKTPKEKFISSQGFIEYECPKHGIKQMKAGNMANGRGCPECNWENHSSDYRYTPDEVFDKIQECGGYLINKQDYVNKYKRNLFITCPICNRPFVSSLVLFTQHGGQICNSCKDRRSIGEKLIKKYLKQHNIDFKEQYWFSDCRDINPLPFDFYLPNLSIVIEFDGRQHFGETNYFRHSIDKIRMHDDIKNNYCKDNNIKIIRIPYWKIMNISKILDNEIIT